MLSTPKVEYSHTWPQRTQCLPQTLDKSTVVALENNSIADVVLFALIFTVTSSVKFPGR